MSLKICIVSPEFPPEIGGIANHVLKLNKYLQLKGHEVTLCVPKKSYLKSGHFISTNKIGPGFIGLIPYYKKSLKKVCNNQNKFDIIHIHGLYSPIPKEIKDKTIVSMHTTYVGKRTASHLLLKEADLFSLSLPKKIETMFNLLYFNTAQRFESTAIKSSSNTIAINDSIESELKEYETVSTMIPNAIDDDIFKLQSNKCRNNKEKEIVYSVGRLIPRKGFSLLLKAIRYVALENKNFEFHLIGMGSEYKHLVNLTKKMGIEQYVKFLGKVPFKKLISEHETNDIFVQSSIYEGLPTTLLEAMACKKPVIALNVPYAFSLIKNGENGLLSNIAPKELAENILVLLSDKKLRKKFGDRNRKRIISKYSWRKVVDEIEKLYYGLN